MKGNTVISSVIFLGIGLGAGYMAFSGNTDEAPAATVGEKEVAYWVAPMDPNYRRDEPGKSPMGMDLIPVYVGEETGGSDVGFQISPNVEANLGVMTAQAERIPFRQEIQATGYVRYDETRTSHVQVRADGWVEDLAVRATGEDVTKGDLLFSFYSPDIANAFADLMQLKGRGNLEVAARSRLAAFGLGKTSIAEVLKSDNPHQPVNVYAPQSGVVTELGIREGSRIAKSKVAFEITDPSQVWMIADVYPGQAGKVEVGQQTTVSGNRTGRVAYIYPDVDPKMQTIRVRLELDNAGGELKAGAYLKATISPESIEQLVVPETAVIRLGDESRVILSSGEGKYEAAMVRTGATANGKTAIVAGLIEGEEVVISGQFMLDSESSFTGASLRMSDLGEHDGHDMEEMPEEVEAEVFAMGTINSVDTDAGLVNISHPEILDIGWPAMTMDMQVVNSIDLSDVKAPQNVRFGLGRNSDGMYVITVIHVMDSEMGGNQ